MLELFAKGGPAKLLIGQCAFVGGTERPTACALLSSTAMLYAMKSHNSSAGFQLSSISSRRSNSRLSLYPFKLVASAHSPK